MIRRRAIFSGGSFLNMVCPINWQNDLNRGLQARWDCMPGLMGGSRLINLTRPGDKDGNHGTLTNGPTWQGALGRPGGYGSILFDAALNHRVTFAAINITAITYCAWVRLTEAGASYIAIVSNKKTILSLNSASSINWWPDTDTTVVTQSYTFNIGQWYHAAATQNGTSYALYVNGLSVASGTTDAIDNGAGPLNCIGGYDTGSFNFPGYIDAAMIYPNRALSASEIFALYEDSRHGSPETLNWISTRSYFGVTAAAATGPIGARSIRVPHIGRSLVTGGRCG